VRRELLVVVVTVVASGGCRLSWQNVDFAISGLELRDRTAVEEKVVGPPWSFAFGTVVPPVDPTAATVDVIVAAFVPPRSISEPVFPWSVGGVIFGCCWRMMPAKVGPKVERSVPLLLLARLLTAVEVPASAIGCFNGSVGVKALELILELW